MDRILDRDQVTKEFQPRILARKEPERLAFRMCDTDQSVTFAQLEARANQGAHLFRVCGVGVGDHVMVLMENRREFLELCFAADRAGIYYTTASTHLTHEELSHIAVDCGAKLIVISEKFLDIGKKLRSILSPKVRMFIIGGKILPKDMESWPYAIAAQPETPIDNELQGLDMLYSSGTTGMPKGVKWPLTQEPLEAPSMPVSLLSKLFGYNANTRYLCPAPLYHAAPLRHTMVTLKMGGTAFIMSKFDAEGALQIIEAEKITHSQWVPTMFIRMLKLPDDVRLQNDISSMSMAIHAAAPCPADVKHQMIAWWGHIIVEYYAGTENNGFTCLDTAEWLTHEGSVGRAKMGVIHICDENGQELPIGKEGEVYFENGHQFEYHNDPDKTAQVTNIEGWTTLGDVGRIDKEGYLYLTDRKSFMIISGGVNVYPQETEDVLIGHPAVLDAAVIGVPNPDYGEEVKAIIQLIPNKAPSKNLKMDLMMLCRSKLSAIKCPRSIDFRATLPRTETGKLLKRRLHDEYWSR